MKNGYKIAFEQIKKECKRRCRTCWGIYIVDIELGYTPDDTRIIRTILTAHNEIIWDDDWYEGEDYIKVLGFININDVNIGYEGE